MSDTMVNIVLLVGVISFFCALIFERKNNESSSNKEKANKKSTSEGPFTY